MNTNLREFVNISEEEIAEVLQPLGFIKVDLANTNEITYSRKIEYEDAPTICRVYTGILKDTGESRPAGQDAIRICLGRMINGKVRIFKTLEKVQRRGTWAKQLTDRIENIGDGLAEIKQQLTEEDLLAGRTEPVVLPKGYELKCPECGSSMVGPKDGKYGVFFGCSHYPKCRGLLNLKDVIDC